MPQSGESGLRLLRRIGHADPDSIDSYRSHGGYGALRAAFDLGPAGVLREVTDAKLLGRGGAAFPDRTQVGGGGPQPAPPSLPGLQRR